MRFKRFGDNLCTSNLLSLELPFCATSLPQNHLVQWVSLTLLALTCSFCRRAVTLPGLKTKPSTGCIASSKTEWST